MRSLLRLLPSRRHAGVTAAIAAAALASAAPAHAFTLGFNDDDLMRSSGWNAGTVDLGTLNAGLAGARTAGAKEWRFMVVWRNVASGATAAPSPASLAADPAWPGYRWDDVDRIMKAVTGNGYAPIAWLARAPDWAEGPGRPAVSKLVPAGTWKPDATMLAQFAAAFAKRYNGSYPDPSAPGTTLPRIAAIQAWNEPNLYTEITPQWAKQNGTWKSVSAPIFRKLQNAVYTSVKAASPTTTVLAAATGPFGGLVPEEDPRTPPALFWRDLLCVKKSGSTLKGSRACPKLSFDGWAHHTYPIGPPTRTARNADDVVVPDMKKLTSIMGAAQRAGTVKSSAAKNLWVTEMSWESAPDPNGLSLDDHAQYLQGALYVLWKAGVQHVLWWNSRDDAKGKDWNNSLQSGIFLRGATPAQDTPKPSFTAYKFPFTAYRLKGVAALWAKPPGAGPVKLQVLSGTTWSDVTTLRPQAGGVVTGRLRVNPGAQLRAVQGSEISLAWKTF